MNQLKITHSARQWRKITRSTLLLGGLLILLATTPAPRVTVSAQQDLTFRLINLERQVESLQTRVDFLERMARSAATSLPTDSLANTQQLELQRQLLALAEQQILIQTQLLELKKSVDRLTEKETPGDRKAPQ